MTPIEVNLVLFIATVVAFAWIGFVAAGKEASAKDYFHHESLRKNVVSLTATNITLGTGLVYLISGAQQNGLLMLLPVFCVGAGYWLLAEFLDRASTIAARTGKNYLAAIDEDITKTTGEGSLFAKAVSFSLVVVFVLLLAFEIFASAKVISPFLFASPSISSEVILSIAIFCITVLYALLGGVRAIFGVDMLQVPLICLFLPVFVVTAIPDWNQPAELAQRLAASFKTEQTVLVAICIACINSLATQFYSLLNWGAVSNVELDQQKKLLRWVGGATTIVLVLFVLVGLLHPQNGTGYAWQDLVQHFSALGASTSPKAYIVSAIIMLGMASILLTTTDAVVVNCVLFWYDNLAGGDSKSAESNPEALNRIRRIGAVTFGVCFAVLCTINYFQPDPFYLLLSMAGGVVVFAPMIVTAGFLATRNGGLRVFSRKIVGCFICLFVVAGIADVFLLSQKSKLVPYVGLTAFVASSLFCLILFWRSNAMEKLT
jgi:hypothetical protein